MKTLVLILSSLFLPAVLLAQAAPTEGSFLLPPDKNQQWLLALKAQEKPWQMIAKRFFEGRASDPDRAAEWHAPLLIINGLLVSVTDSTSEHARGQLASLLTEDKISDIKVMEKLPEGLILCKPFTGMLIVSVTDKRAARALKRINLQ